MSSSAPAEKKSFALKRSLFTKPVLSKAADSSDDDDDEDIFSRSKHAFRNLAAEAEAARAKKASQKLQQSAEASCDSKKKDEGSEPRAKRIRLSAASESGDAKEEADQREHEGKPSSPIKSPKKSPVLREHSTAEQSLSRSYESTLAAKSEQKEPLGAVVIDLDDDDDEQNTQKEPQEEVETKPATADDIPADDQYSDPAESDAELRELARQAREKARSKRLQEETVPRSTPDQLQGSRSDSFGLSGELGIKAPEEPHIEILITCPIPSSTALIAKRKLGQRLKEVRLEWCHRQGYTGEMADNILLTFNGNKIYDSTTCRGLGFRVDGLNRVIRPGENELNWEDNPRVHLEAMTQEAVDELEKQKERPEKAGQDENHNSEPPPEESKEQKIRVILQGEHKKELKLVVRPSTLIIKLVNAFRCQVGPDAEDKDVFLMMDGERLDSQWTVADNGIEDMDVIEVHVK